MALLLARLIVGGTLIYASLDKIKDPVTFLKSVRGFGLIPEKWPMVLNSVAVIIPWIELIGGIVLVLGLGLVISANALGISRQRNMLRLAISLRGTALVILLMLIAFTTAIALRTWNIMEDTGQSIMEIEFDCGCGTGATVIWIKLLKNLGLILLSLFIALSRSYRTQKS